MVVHLRPVDCSRFEKAYVRISADGHRKDGTLQISSRHIPRSELRNKD